MGELLRIAQLVSDYIIPTATAIIILGIIPAAAFFRITENKNKTTDENK